MVVDAVFDRRGLMKEEMTSGVCWPRNEEVKNELPSLLREGVPWRKPIVGGVTLLYISIDCLKKEILIVGQQAV